MADQWEVALIDLLRVQTEQHDVVRNWKRSLNVAEISELVVETKQADCPDDADHTQHVGGHKERGGHDDQLLDDLRMVRWRPIAHPSFVIKPGQVVCLRIVIAKQIVFAFDHLF